MSDKPKTSMLVKIISIFAVMFGLQGPIHKTPEGYGAAVYDPYNITSGVRIEKVAMPHLGENDVMIRMNYVSLNPADWKLMAMAEKYGVSLCNPSHDEFCGLGLDGTGYVVKTGRCVHGLKTYDVVAVNCRNVLGEYAVCNQENVVKVPFGRTRKGMATYINTAMTSSVALIDKCGLKSDFKGKILIIGGGSSTGKNGIQIAKGIAPKSTVIAVCSDLWLCKLDGADFVINYKNETLEEGLNRILGLTDELDDLGVVYETIKTPDSYDITKRRNAKCFVTIDPGNNIFSVANTYLSQYYRLLSPPFYFFINENYINRGTMDRLAELSGKGILKKHNNVVEFDFDTENINKALDHIKSGKRGKVVIVVSRPVLD